LTKEFNRYQAHNPVYLDTFKYIVAFSSLTSNMTKPNLRLKVNP